MIFGFILGALSVVAFLLLLVFVLAHTDECRCSQCTGANQKEERDA